MAYADVEELLFPGYLSASFEADQVALCLRSNFPADYYALKARTTNVQSVRDWKEWAVAHAIWQVDGQIIPANEVNAPYKVRQLLRGWNNGVIDALFSLVSQLRSRVEHALMLVEGYSYEQTSRGRWRMTSKHNPSEQAPPWILSLGSNRLQQLWVAYNLAEDDRVRWDNEWYAAKTIASTMAPKWVKQMSEEENRKWKEEEARRNRVMEYARQGRVPPVEQTEEYINGVRVFRLRTNEDLIEQMRRWQRGEYDEHDLIVQKYKDGIRQRQEAAASAHAERLERLSLDRDFSGVAGQAKLVGYTAEQLAELGIDQSNKTPRKIVDDTASGMLYDRYIAQEPRLGGLRPDGRGGELEDPGLLAKVAGRKVSIS